MDYVPFAPVPPGVDWKEWAMARTGKQQEELIERRCEKMAEKKATWERELQERQQRIAAINTAFPEPVSSLSEEEKQALGAVNNSLLKRHSLVVYRCGYKRPKGAVRGCFLGAVLNVKGDKYWARSQVLTPGSISSDEISSQLEYGGQEWGAYADVVLDASVDDSGVDDFEAMSIAEARQLNAISGYKDGITVIPAWYFANLDNYWLCGVNCAHTEAWIDSTRVMRDIEAVKNERNKTVYLTGMLGSGL